MNIDFSNIGNGIRHLVLDFSSAAPDIEITLPKRLPKTLESLELRNVKLSEDSDVSEWDVSCLTSTTRMFNETPVPCGVNNWDLSGVTNTAYMFAGAIFEVGDECTDLTNLDVSDSGNMESMFAESNFNQDISGWTVNSSRVQFMFEDAENMSQDLSSLVLPNVYFLDMLASGEVTDTFAPGSGMTTAQYPKTAIEAGVGFAPLEFKTEGGEYFDTLINSSGTATLYIQSYEGGVETHRGAITKRQLGDIYQGGPAYIKLYGFQNRQVTLMNVTEVSAWGNATHYQGIVIHSDEDKVTVPNTAPPWQYLTSLFWRSKPGPEIENWDVSHVMNLDYFMNGDWGHDLSGWSVPNITREPKGWTLPPERSPQWGV